MAEFSCNGLDDLMLSFQEIAAIPEEVQDEMLRAGAEVVAQAQREKVKAYGIYDGSSPRHVADAIKPGKVKPGKVKLKKGQRVIYVTPSGSRRRGKSVTRNAEILFVNEYGKRGQKARPAIRDANEACAEQMVNAQMAVYDKHLRSKDL